MNEILNASEMKRIIMRMYHEFVEDVQDLKKVSLIGIRSGGVFLAERLKQYLKEFDDLQVDMGFLDITLYRDDLSRLGYLPTLKKTDIQFSIDNRIILLVDDVIYSGRTIRAAMDALIDFGRPAVIKLA
ncbi:MAG TPA: bifunctional pyr operon transcriptional regulator/uracil phosphoribosyltransferase PyrR, partial [bacterium]